MGYSLFKVVHQADTVGAYLKEVQESLNDVKKFSKMVNLVSFLPFEYVVAFFRSRILRALTPRLETTSKRSARSMTSLKASRPTR